MNHIDLQGRVAVVTGSGDEIDMVALADQAIDEIARIALDRPADLDDGDAHQSGRSQARRMTQVFQLCTVGGWSPIHSRMASVRKPACAARRSISSAKR